MHIRLTGGLGNQLFQYAYGRAREREGHPVTFDRKELLDDDGSPHHRDRPRYGLDKFKLKPIAWAEPPENCEKGFYQGERYFLPVEQELYEELVPIDLPKTVLFLGGVLRGQNSVAIHVRRGDYLDLDAHYHGTLSPAYYEAARALVPDATPYHFSDDKECNLHGTGNRFYDFYLMSQCRNIIIANSSFSWWAAFAGDKDRKGKVICPGQWAEAFNWAGIQRERWVSIWEPHFWN